MSVEKPALHVPETKVPKPRFPVIDCHVHLSSVVQRPMPSSDVPVKEGPEGPQASMSTRPEDVIALMDRKNIRVMVNATGGYGPALDEVIRYWHKPYPDRFLVCVEPWWTRTNEPGYPNFQAGEVERAARAGARGLKLLKTLGLYLRENLTSGPLVKIDDRRFDPMWEAAGGNRLPVLIHVSDPESFFDPVDSSNERSSWVDSSSSSCLTNPPNVFGSFSQSRISARRICGRGFSSPFPGRDWLAQSVGH